MCKPSRMHDVWLPGSRFVPVVREGVAALADNARGACIWRLLDLQLVLLLPLLHILILHPPALCQCSLTGACQPSKRV